jgi:hypothetical protein
MEQGFFNAARVAMDNAVAVTGDYLLLNYARGGPDSLDRLLRSARSDGALEFALPLYADAERPPIIAAVEARLRDIGGGDIEAGKALAIGRSTRFYDTIRRVAP